MPRLYEFITSVGVIFRSLIGIDSGENCNNSTSGLEETAIDHGPRDIRNVFNIGGVEHINISNDFQGNGVSGHFETDAAIVTDWIKEANKKTMSEVQNDVAVLFPFLASPKTQETPKLKDFEYYRGCGSFLKSHYTPDNNFSEDASREIMGLPVSIEKLHVGVGCDDTRHVMLLGCAGAGKTTLVKRYAKMVLNRQVEKLKHVKLVLYLEFRHLCFDDRVTPREVFIERLFPHMTEGGKIAAFDWMKSNSESILFAMDGFDQAEWNLDGSHPQISYDTRTEMSTLCYNLFNGHLFPGSWLLTSSRDHAIQSLEGKVRPNKTIQLEGLTKSSVENLVKGYGGSKGESIWHTLSSMKSGILSFCTIPVFLVFATSALYEQDDDAFPADTLSGIMLRVLLSLIRSQHAHKANAINILKKLQVMAFRGMKAGKVQFRIHDLVSVGLQYQDVEDLAVTVPAQTRSRISQRFVEGSSVIFFCHQSVQETLAALHVTQMSPHNFEKFVLSELNEPRWSIVRLLVYGSILHPETSDFRREICSEHEEDACSYSGNEKRRILLRYLQTKENVDLQILAVLHEAGEGANEAIEACSGAINLSNTPLSDNNMHILASVALRRLSIQSLNFRSCDLGPDTLDELTTALMGSELKVYKLNVADNKFLGESGFGFLGMMVKQCRVDHLCAENCELNAKTIRALKENAKEKAEPIFSFDVSWNQNMKFDGFVELGGFVMTCRVKNIHLRRCDLNARNLLALELVLKGSGYLLDVFDVGENYTLDAECCRIIGDFVGRHRVHSLFMNDCNLASKTVKSLEKSLVRGHAQVKVLDMSVNKELDRQAMNSLGNIVTFCFVRYLNLRHCEIDASDLYGLRCALTSGEQKLILLDLGWNTTLGVEGYKILVEVLSLAKVEKLVLDNCEITHGELQTFGQEIKHRVTELKIFDISYNRLNRQHINALSDFLEEILEKLKLSADQMENAQKQIFTDVLSSANADIFIEWG